MAIESLYAISKWIIYIISRTVFHLLHTICQIIAFDKGMPLVNTLVLRNLLEYLHCHTLPKTRFICWLLAGSQGASGTHAGIQLRAFDTGCQNSESIYTTCLIVWQRRRSAVMSTNWWQSLFCRCTASMEQAADGAETAAINRVDFFIVILKYFCLILFTCTRIRIDSVMCPRSSSRLRSTSASVILLQLQSLGDIFTMDLPSTTLT